MKKTNLRLVAGTDIDGPGPSVVEDPNGAERALKGVLASKPLNVVIYAEYEDGSVEAYSNLLVIETLGLTQVGMRKVE